MKRILRRRAVEEGAWPDGLGAGLHPVLARVYRSRRVRAATELGLGLDRLAPADRLSGLGAAVSLLEQQVRQGGRIVLVGDFDADGATSCALAILALRAMGHDNVGYLVPNRFSCGYGLSPPVAEMAARDGAELLVTVDNGISSIEGVEAARRLGLQVLVTDHHLPGPTLPAADAIVNPNLPDDAFPSKHLAGVGVVFYVLAALRQRLRDVGWFREGRPEPGMAQWLDLVALGTVADVVPLDRNNRILVEQGLRRIRAGCCRPGLRALLELSGRDPGRVVAADLGFAAGPRLNAAGRLEDMALGIECLLAEDPAIARTHAARLDVLNSQRRDIERQMECEALAGLESLEKRWSGGSVPAGLCLMDPAWHQGVIGILASRIRERFQRPVAAFAPAGDLLKGSCRSIAGLHIRDLLERIASDHPGLIDRFGGHAAAAGLSLRPDRFDAFRAAFEAAAEEAVAPEMLQQVLLTDGPLEAADFGLDLARAIRNGGPWGQGFPEPLFDNTFEILQRRVVGGVHLRLDLRPRMAAAESAPVLEGIAFRALEHGWDSLGRHVRAAYRLDVNHWRNAERLQLVVDYMEAAD